MKTDRDVELLQCIPQRFAGVVVQMLTVDGIGRADHGDRAEFFHAASRFFHRTLHVVHRDLGGEFQALRILLAVVVRPVVVGARERCGVPGLQIVMVEDRLTYVDLSMFQLIEGLRFAFPKTMKRIEADYPGLVALHDRVAARPNIAAYLKSPRRLGWNDRGVFRYYAELDE